MGFLSKGVCYPTAAEARADHCSNALTHALVGGDVHVAACTSSDFELMTYDMTTAVNGVVTGVHQLVYPPFPDCSHTYTAELILLWLGAVMLLAATLWGLRKLYELFSGGPNE